MSDQPEQTEKEGDAQRGDLQDRHDAEQGRGHEPEAPRSSDQRQFSDFALI